MKLKNLLLGCMLGLISAVHAEEGVLKTQKDLLSYGVGVSVARNFKKQETDVDVDWVVQGMKDGLSGKRLLIPERELHKILNRYQMEVRQRVLANRRMAMVENLKKADAYLLANKGKEGVVVLPSGVQYRVVQAGTGNKPTESDSIVCHYRGTLLDGDEFDGTDPGQPATLKMAALIQGWKEALKLMPVGSKWEIAVPPKMAYGERGVGADIGPNELLLFEVELLAIK